VQPAIPENPPIDAIVPPTENKSSEHQKDDGLPVDVNLPVKHVLSRELQMYFDKIAELIMTRSDTFLFKEALVSLTKDSGLHPLVPYFSYFIAGEVTQSLGDLPVLFALMCVVQSLLHNPHIHIEPYLHQLMPSMITCIVAKSLGHRLSDNHWELRYFSANLVASICWRFGHVYHNLQNRLTKTLIHAFLDPAKSLTQHYGAVQGISALGSSAVVPN
jgi:transcription initiation factor TFIID subunit 6